MRRYEGRRGAPAALLVIALTAVFLTPQGTLSLYGLSIPYSLVVGGLAAALLLPIFACFCSHTIYHYVLLLDAGLKERFDRAARDSVSLFDERRRVAQRDLRQISVDTVLAAKQVKDLRSELLVFGLAAVLALAASVLLQNLAAVMAALLLCEAAGLLLHCRGQIGRDFQHPGPAAADYDRLDQDVEAFEQQHTALLRGCVSRQKVPSLCENT